MERGTTRPVCGRGISYYYVILEFLKNVLNNLDVLRKT